MTTLLDDAFRHHVWATRQLLVACGSLSEHQLTTPCPGTYGSIIDTLRHIVAADRWYLSFFPQGADLAGIDDESEVGLDELAAEMNRNGTAWSALLETDPGGETDVPEQGDAWTFHAPMGFRLAQVVHHGTDHRSQICTALTSLGIEPPEIDVWKYGEMTGRTRGEGSTAD